ncbi:hypothetical protein [Streptomyces sp. SAS_275]|uniref:hypothetical protein n=1 Tax=Streptomyces sp. SAS_275 TaxID=3412746 RepID=UPI00403C754E
MTDVTAGQQLALLSQWFDYSGGALTDLDATPTITIVAIATGTPALAATSTGVTHPGIGSYGYAWTPAANLTAGAYLATWSGLKSGAPVAASETVTVLPAGTSGSAVAQEGVWYATREDVMRALDSKLTARNSGQIDRALESVSRDIESLCHRIFCPRIDTKGFDWPDSQQRPAWRLWLDDNELISLTAISSGGTPIATGNVLLEPNRSGPPYNRVELNTSTSAAFGGGATRQRDVSITGLWGYRNTETTIGALAEDLDAAETSADVTGACAALAGVGSVLRVDAERMLVTGRTMLDTGQNLASDIDQQVKTVMVPVPDSSGYAVDEVILIDAERMLIVDIAGPNLIVKRAWDGTANAAHASGADIYAPRSLTVTRGALGTTAAAHSNGSTVHRWDPPGLVRDLAIAEAVGRLNSETSGYTRALRSGQSGSERNKDQGALEGLRQTVYDAHGRKARMRSV